MRHGKKFNHLSRKAGHRKALLTNMSAQLIMNKRIQTTLAKAKALRKHIEPVITRSKDDTTHNRRMAFRYLQDKTAVTELFSVVADKVGDRPGGYTRVLRAGFRPGDAAEMAFIELVDFNDTYVKEEKKKRTRRGRSKKAAGTAAATAAAVTAAQARSDAEEADTKVVSGSGEEE